MVDLEQEQHKLPNHWFCVNVRFTMMYCLGTASVCCVAADSIRAMAERTALTFYSMVQHDRCQAATPAPQSRGWHMAAAAVLQEPIFTISCCCGCRHVM